jgi:hypothetical protein
MLYLHPDQAEELVECARDHIKKQALLKNTEDEVAAAAKILSLEISEKLKMEATATTAAGASVGVHGDDYQVGHNSHHQHHGPMLSWFRKRVWPFNFRWQHHAISTTAMASKKLP